MGRGGGGGGASAGGGAAGGRERLGAEDVKKESQTIPGQGPTPTYLPEGSKVDSNQQVIAPETGFIKSDPNKYTIEEAKQRLRDMGVPETAIATMAGPGAIQEVASILPDDAKYLGWGAEAFGMKISEDKMLRIQYNSSSEPLKPYDIGPRGAYFDWQHGYGKGNKVTYVQQKSMVKHMAEEAFGTDLDAGRAELAKSFKKYLGTKYGSANSPQDFEDKDLHMGNFGWDVVNGKKVWKVTDPGAILPPGDTSVLAGW